jgi:cytochrome P450
VPAATPLAGSVPAHVPDRLVAGFDFRNDAAYRADPWGRMRELSSLPDIFWSSDLGGYWVVTRGELIEEVFSDHERFSVRSLSVPPVEHPPFLIPNSLEPPEHGKYRRIFSQKMFSPRALGSMEQDTRATARRLLAGFEKTGRCEFVGEFARILPIETFLAMMGVDPARRDDFLPWVQAVFRGESAEEIGGGFVASAGFLAEWLDRELADRESPKSGHMLRAMLDSEVDGRPLSRDEMLSMSMMLFLGGLDTVTSQSTHVFHFLATQPTHCRSLASNPALIPKAIEEMLRRFGISHIGRVVAKDQDFHGVAMKEGDPIIASTALAGIDGTAFADPLAIRFDRFAGKPRHWAFGAGPHLCPGAHLARVQLKVMCEELLPRLKNLRLQDGARISYLGGATLMLKELPLAWDAA